MVGDEDAGSRLDIVVSRHWSRSRSSVQAAIRAGDITVDGAEARPSHRLASGEVVEGDIPVPEEEELRPEDIELDVRYSDDRIMVVSKPAGLVTHPGAGNVSGTLVNALLGGGGPLAHRSGRRPGIVHRLDKDTSGLLLVARDDEAHAFLTAALKARDIARTYVALVRGTMPTATGTIDAPLGRHPRNRRRFAVVPEGRRAVTHYRVLGTAGGTSLLEVDLETGRTHQIRVHLAHLKHPVLGDPTYGGRSELSRSLGLERPFLHAVRLDLPHPEGGRRRIEDPLPADLTEALARAGFPT